MSTRALMLAVRDFLRDTPSLKLTKDNCRIMFEGRPTNIAAEKFVAIWWGSWKDNASHGESLDTEHGIQVTVSWRVTDIMLDRLGDWLCEGENCFYRYCERIAVALHMDQPLLNEGGKEYQSVVKRANDIIQASGAANGIIEPLQFLDGGVPTRRGGDWWGSQGEPLAGVSQTLTFGHANRVQTLESMT